jgi:hypothetical protein
LLPENHSWRDLPVPRDLVLYRGGDGITPAIRVLFDPATGWTYVMYTVG